MKPQPIDYRTLSQFRGVLREANEKICPDKATRLTTQIQAHYLERLFERFTDKADQARVLIDTIAWIKANYPMLQREATWERKIQHRIHCTNGATSVIVVFNGGFTLRTCWLYEPKESE